MNDIERAIEKLKTMKNTVALFKGEGEALDLAISVLEKQILKKPKTINHGTNVCPECQCDLLRWYTHCPDCGQKLDWSEVEQ